LRNGNARGIWRGEVESVCTCLVRCQWSVVSGQWQGRMTKAGKVSKETRRAGGGSPRRLSCGDFVTLLLVAGPLRDPPVFFGRGPAARPACVFWSRARCATRNGSCARALALLLGCGVATATLLRATRLRRPAYVFGCGPAFGDPQHYGSWDKTSTGALGRLT
jgi:hypothetical protein